MVDPDPDLCEDAVVVLADRSRAERGAVLVDGRLLLVVLDVEDSDFVLKKPISALPAGCRGHCQADHGLYMPSTYFCEASPMNVRSRSDASLRG